MFRDAYQRGLLTVFFSKGASPFNIWEVKTKDGYVRAFLDQDLKSMVCELRGNNVSTTYMICPKGRQVLGITMPMLVMIVKNLHKYFSFEVTILDDTGTRRRFRVSNFQSTTQILPLCTVMPLSLSPGWNQIQFNLAEFCRRAYQKQFIEVQKIKINANIRLRRIYFAEKLMPEDELPADYKLFFPLEIKARKKLEESAKAAVVSKATSVTKKEDALKPPEEAPAPEMEAVPEAVAAEAAPEDTPKVEIKEEPIDDEKVETAAPEEAGEPKAGEEEKAGDDQIATGEQTEAEEAASEPAEPAEAAEDVEDAEAAAGEEAEGA